MDHLKSTISYNHSKLINSGCLTQKVCFCSSIYILDSHYLRLKIRFVCVGIFNLENLLIEFVIPNMSQIFIVYQTSLKRTKSPFDFLFSCCEFTKVILKSKCYWNFRIKAFWYKSLITKSLQLNPNWNSKEHFFLSFSHTL